MSLPPALRGQRGGVFLLYGDDGFRRGEAERSLSEAHLDPASRDFNYDIVWGREIKPEALIARLTTPPMMGKFRVVVLRNAEALAANARLRKALLGVVETPPPDLTAIIAYTLPRGRPPKFFQSLRKISRSAEFRQLADHELPGWVIGRARTHGADIEPEAARAIAAAIGNDTGILARETEKLAAVAGGGPVTLEDVEQAGIRVPTMDRWRWFDLVAGRSFGRALDSLWDVMYQAQTGRSESGVALVVGLTNHFLQLGLAVEGGRKRLAAAVPPHRSWLVDRILRQAKGWTPAEVESALDGLLRLDQLLKASPHTDAHFMEEWLLAREAKARSLRATRSAA